MFPCRCCLLTLVRCPYVILATMLIAFTSAIPIPNGQIGKAEVECGENTIEVVFLTEQVFQGRVYVVGHANEPECQSRDTGRRTTSITIPKDKCSVVTTRSTNPPGLFVNVKVMISFHEAFITKVDRGYEISCFYMEADKTVTYPLTVSLEPFTELAEMPRCRYEVVDPQTMDPVTVVSVGNKLLHKWTCDSTAPSLWCMTVHSCAVEDGSGTQFVILNDNGCSVDKYLLGNLEYGPGDLAAQKEAHAFKFADRVVVNFQCSIRLDIRDGQCPRPQCTETRRTRRLFSRSADMPPSEQLTIGDPESITSAVADIDVRAQQIDVLDPKIDFGLNVNDERLRSAIERAAQSVRPDVMRINNGFRHCVPFSLFVVSGGLCAALSASLIIVASTLCRHTTRKL